MAKSPRDKQKLEKKRKKARARQNARKSKNQGAARARNASFADAASWDWAECFLTETWMERGASVMAVVHRRHSSDARVAVFFEIDLADGEIRWKALQGAHPAEVQQMLVRVSQDHPMVMVEPETVLAVLEAALRERSRKDKGLPAGFASVREIFGDVQADSSEVLTGTADDPGEEQVKPGLWANLRSKIGL